MEIILLPSWKTLVVTFRLFRLRLRRSADSVFAPNVELGNSTEGSIIDFDLDRVVEGELQGEPALQNCQAQARPDPLSFSLRAREEARRFCWWPR